MDETKQLQLMQKGEEEQIESIYNQTITDFTYPMPPQVIRSFDQTITPMHAS